MRLMNVINSLGSTGHCTGDSSESIEIGLINECGPQKLHELTEGRQGGAGERGFYWLRSVADCFPAGKHFSSFNAITVSLIEAAAAGTHFGL